MNVLPSFFFDLCFAFSFFFLGEPSVFCGIFKVTAYIQYMTPRLPSTSIELSRFLLFSLDGDYSPFSL